MTSDMTEKDSKRSGKGVYITKEFIEKVMGAVEYFSPDTNTNINTLIAIYNKNTVLAKAERINKKVAYEEQKKNKNLMSLVGSKDLLTWAYYKLAKNKGAMTPGTEGQTSDGISDEMISELSRTIRTGTFEWAKTKRIWIPKPGKSTLRPLNLNDFHNKMVQETIRLVLQSIYEPRFESINLNFGFRSSYSPRDSVATLYSNLSGKTYVIEGDIKGAYDNVDHDIMLDLLKKHVHDEDLLSLIRKGFKTKIFDFPTKQTVDPLLGIPQGGIASPLLFNIYMHEFDLVIQDQIKVKYESNTEQVTRKGHSKSYLTTKSRKDAINKSIKRINKQLSPEGWRILPLAKKIGYAEIEPEYKEKLLKHKKRRKYLMLKEKKNSEAYRAASTIDFPISDELLDKFRNSKINALEEAKDVLVRDKYRNQDDAVDFNKHVRRLIYNRYADDFVIMTSGPLKEAEQVKSEIKTVLHQLLRLSLSEEKTKITYIRNEPIRYLGFELYLSRFSQYLVRKTDKVLIRAPLSKNVAPDRERLTNRFKLRGIINDDMEPEGIGILTNLEDHEIVEKFNQIISGLGNYYVHNITRRSYLSKWHYLLYLSCLKTLAIKHHCKIGHILVTNGFRDLSVNINSKFLTDQRICIKYIVNETKRWQVLTNWKEFTLKLDYNQANRVQMVDTIDLKAMDRINLRTKFRMTTCCFFCGSEERIQMHHIRPIRAKPTDKKQWNHIDLLVRNLGRRQIPLCEQCHKNVHNGKIQKKELNEVYARAVAAPESVLNDHLKKQKKLILTGNQIINQDKARVKAALKSEYPIIINEFQRTYYNPLLKQKQLEKCPKQKTPPMRRKILLT